MGWRVVGCLLGAVGGCWAQGLDCAREDHLARGYRPGPCDCFCGDDARVDPKADFGSENCGELLTSFSIDGDCPVALIEATTQGYDILQLQDCCVPLTNDNPLDAHDYCGATQRGTCDLPALAGALEELVEEEVNSAPVSFMLERLDRDMFCRCYRLFMQLSARYGHHTDIDLPIEGECIGDAAFACPDLRSGYTCAGGDPIDEVQTAMLSEDTDCTEWCTSTAGAATNTCCVAIYFAVDGAANMCVLGAFAEVVPVADSEFASFPPEQISFSACRARESRIGDDVGAHGKCDAIADRTVCEDSAHGSRCSWGPIRARDCKDVDCGVHGACDQTTGTCVCDGGSYWIGDGAGCEPYSGNEACWTGDRTYDRCCNPQDGAGDTSCWEGVEFTYQTCQCEAPSDAAEPVTYACFGRSSAFDQLYRCFDGVLAGLLVQPTADMVEQVCPGDFTRCRAAAGCMEELWSHLSTFGACTDRDLLESMEGGPSLACLARVCPAELDACWMPRGTAECTAVLSALLFRGQEEPHPSEFPQEVSDVYMCYSFVQLQYRYGPCVEASRCEQQLYSDLLCQQEFVLEQQAADVDYDDIDWGAMECSMESVLGDCEVCMAEVDCERRGISAAECFVGACSEITCWDRSCASTAENCPAQP